jgi:hypothetical protein
MLEFTSKPKKAVNPFTLIIALGVVVILGSALVLYINYQSGIERGPTAVVVPDLLRPGNTDFDYYKTRIRLENIKGSLGISFSEARIAIISGTIVNDGDRKLEALELHITLNDEWGNILKERTAFALRPGAGYSSKPMEPLEERPFTIGVESIGQFWDPRQIICEITGIRYK